MKEFLEFDSEEQDLIQRVSRLEEELYRARLALKLHRERCQMARKRRLEEIDEAIKVLALEEATCQIGHHHGRSLPFSPSDDFKRSR